MIGNLSDNNSTHSNDKIKKRQKKLNLLTEDDDINNLKSKESELKDSKTPPNIDNLEQINENPILEYKTKYNAINTEKTEQNNENKDTKKKKIEKKVNRNLKLLRIIKERMKEQKYKNMFEEEKKENENINPEENYNSNEKNIEENLDNNNMERKEEITEKENKMPNNNDEEKGIKKKEEEEKKSKLLNIISSKKFNKFQRRDLEEFPKITQDKTNNKTEIRSLSTDTPKLKYNIKEENTQENKSNNIEIEKNHKSKEILMKIISPSEKKENEKENQKEGNKENGKEVNLSSKKGALKILELLKMKKKGENENIESTIGNDTINTIESERINKVIDPYNLKIKKKDFEKVKRDRNLENSLPKKSFRDEEDEKDKNYDFKNRTQKQFRIYNNKSMKVKNKSYFNLSNKNIDPFNKNNNISNTNSLNDSQNYSKIDKIKNPNPISIKNNISERIQNFYTINNEKYKPKIKYSKIIPSIKKDKNTIASSSNLNKKRKIPISKKILNKSLINPNIYKPKRISGNNSPLRNNYSQFERNTINTESITNNIINNLENKNPLNLTKINKGQKAYFKKSPEKYINPNYSINNNTIDNIYNRKNKKIINSQRNSNNFNTSFNKIFDNSNNKINQNNDNYYENYSSSLNHYNDINNINRNKNIKSNIQKKSYNQKSMLFNLEDLMVLEERLNNIISAIENNENIDNKCFNFWNYYFNCSLYNILDKVFRNKEDSNIARICINYKLLSIMVCYEYSFEIEPSDEEIYLFLLELMDLNHYNLIIICEYILNKVIPENKQNIWVIKLQHIINKSKSLDFNKLHQNNSSKSPIEKINFNINLIIKSLKNILLNFPTKYSDILISLLKKIDTKTYDEINDFFREYILRVDNFEGSIIASSYLKKNKFFKPLPAPYIISPPTKQYTLVLDLDETLVHFKMKTNKGGTLKARPYLFGFLEEMGHYYELIVWTSATEAYANSLIEAIEYEKQYFDYILFREHAIIIGDDFVKDLTRIGRSLDSIIIIDDMPQNFRLQKENGITIKPYFGDDIDDSALYELVPILKHIAEEGIDVRIGLEKYREEIVKRVTSNISKQNLY